MNNYKDCETVWTSDQGRVGGTSSGGSSKKRKKQKAPLPDAGFPKDGVTRVRRETGGRGGKTVTVLYGVPGSPDDRMRLCKDLKKICGCGGAVKDGRVEIQGDHRDAIMTVLQEKNIEARAAGG